MKVEVLNPKAYCSGVVNAIFVAKKAKRENPDKQVMILGRLVHNNFVVKELKDAGIETLYAPNKSLKELLLEAPNDGVIVFSAHGHDEKLDQIAKEKRLIIYDAVCPKVKENLKRIKNEIANNHQVIFIGKSHHPEAEASISISDNVSLYDTQIPFNYQLITDESPLIVNQTTLNIVSILSAHQEIKAHFPHARIEDEICSTTRLRQEAIINLPNTVDLIIVVGDNFSSNSTRLLEIARESHPDVTSVMISSVDDLDTNLIQNKNHIVISSGASTPPELIDMIVHFLENN